MRPRSLTSSLLRFAATTCFAAVASPVPAPSGRRRVCAHCRSHASGNAEMAANLPGAPIYGSAVAPPPAITHPLTPPTPFKWGTLTITPHGAAAHTIGSLLYHVTSPTDAAGVLFTGDTLFTAGCGRFFEGTPAAMVAAAATIRGLPSATRVYGGHEYTAANVAFGRAVEPGNADLAALEGAVRVKRARGELCVPSCVGAEGGWNVFCRTAVAGVAAAVGGGGRRRSWPSSGRGRTAFDGMEDWKENRGCMRNPVRQRGVSASSSACMGARLSAKTGWGGEAATRERSSGAK